MSTKRFYGDAPAVAEIWTITPANVNVGNTFTVTINGKSITVTATAATVANVTALLAEAWNESDILEFAELEAVDNTTHVTATMREAGVPTVITASASGGTATNTESKTTAASGPNFWDTAANWDGDTIPVDGDDVILMPGCSDILYALTQTTIGLLSLTAKEGSGKVGLPEVRVSGGSTYDEFRETFLSLEYVTTLTIETKQGRFKLNTGTAGACTATIRSTTTREDTDVPSILLKGAHASNAVHILKGDVGINFYEEASQQWPTINVGYTDDQDSDSRVVVGKNTTVTTVTISGGKNIVDSATTLVRQYAGNLLVTSGGHAELNIDGGLMTYLSASAISSWLRVGSGGTADFSRDMRGKTVANAEINAGGTIRDPYSVVTWTNGIDLARCKLSEVTLDIGEHKTISVSAI